MKKSIQENFIARAVRNLAVIAVLLTLVLVIGFLHIEVLHISDYSTNLMAAIRDEIRLQQLSYVQTLTQIENYLLAKPLSGASYDKTTLNHVLDRAKLTSQYIDRIYILNRQGMLITADDLGTGTNSNNQLYLDQDHSAQPYFKEVRGKKTDYWSNAFITYESGTPKATVSRDIGSCVIVIRFDLMELSDSLQQRMLTPHSFIAVVDSAGEYVAHTDYQNVITRAKEPYFTSIKDGSYKGFHFYKERLMLIFNNKLEQNQWTILFGYSVADMTQMLLLYIAVSLLIVAVILYLFLRTGMRHYEALKQDFSAIRSTSDLVADGIYEIPPHPDLHYTEVEHLDQTLRAMSRQIAERETQLESRKDQILSMNNNLENQVKQRTRELKDMNDKLAASLNELIQAQAKLSERENQEAEN